MIRKMCRVLVAVPLFFVAGCSSDFADLTEYMNGVRQRPAKPIEPIPVFPQYRSFTYSAASFRSPFELPVAKSDLPEGEENKKTVAAPDQYRNKEALEKYGLGDMTMVGTLSKNDNLWALVDDGAGNVHRVLVGNYMGRNYGRIVSISNNEISLIETVSDGAGGWVERPQNLRLVTVE